MLSYEYNFALFDWWRRQIVLIAALI